MPWDDAAQLETELNRALDSFDWQGADAICEEIIRRVSVDTLPLPETSARRLMQSLRRKSRFRSMTLLAEALLQSGLRTPQVRRQYAQGLIDQGMFLAAEQVLQSIIQDPQVVVREQIEARGLMGRIYKQLYINNNDPASPRNRANLERALNEYLSVYRLDPRQHFWHGINAVALTERARRDGLPTTGLPDASALAAEIIASLDRREEEGEPVYAWDEATRMEAYVALGRHKDAADTAMRYLDARDTDAFELQSTIRQLTQVWQLSDEEPPGNLLLPILKAGQLRRAGGGMDFDAKKIASEAKAAEKADPELEAIFSETRMAPFRWYRKGLAQCNSVARIERRDGTGHGTGWLVNAADFFPGWTGVLLLTNNHVISDPENPHSILPGDSQVNFQAVGEVYDVENQIVWQSSYKELDATFLRLKGEGVPKAAPLILHERLMKMADPPPRMYIIGHPNGRDLEISLQDNLLVACNERLVHYRTPTEPGSSGSPVFEPEDWRVVALHHKGSNKMQRIDGQAGTYEANEGITLQAIQEQTRSAGLPPPASPPGGRPREVRAPS
jgi:Trypsin-like peptidase domain